MYTPHSWRNWLPIAVYGEDPTMDRTCQKWFVKFLGTIDILAKELFAVGLPYALEDV